VTAPIVGASKMEQLEQAIAALDIALTDDECRQLEELYEPHRVRW
jgi:1-deoxyxylulose-5-phosphate synthase